jgi:hypothetical protein
MHVKKKGKIIKRTKKGKREKKEEADAFSPKTNKPDFFFQKAHRLFFFIDHRC